MINFIKAVLFFIHFWIITLFHFLWIAVERLVLRLLGRDQSEDQVHEKASKWGRALIKTTPGWDLKIYGGEHIKKHQNYVITANHESAADIFAMYCLGIQFRWLSKEEVFRLPLIGAAMRWAGYVSVKRRDPHSRTQAMRESAKILAEKSSMLFFPEGTRSEDGRLKAFKSGAFRLAYDSNKPVLPIILRGTRDLLRKGSTLPRKATVYIKVLPPVYPQDFASYEELLDKVYDDMKVVHIKWNPNKAKSLIRNELYEKSAI